MPLDGSLAEGLYGLLLSPGKSLFLYAPIALVAVLALPVAVRRAPAETAMISAIALANLILFARFPFWHGDQAWGPRYLLITLPVVLLLIAPALSSVRWRRTAAATAAVGVASAALGVFVGANQYAALARERIGAGVDADGAPAYWDETHFSVRHSPIIGHAELLPSAVRASAARLDGVDASFGETGRFPDVPNLRFFWYHEPPQVDVWPYWIVVQGSPSALLLLVLIPLGAAMAGMLLLHRLRVDPGWRP